MQDEDGFAVGVAEGGVVQAQFGQGLAAGEAVVRDDPFVFFLVRIGGFCLGEGGEAEYAEGGLKEAA